MFKPQRKGKGGEEGTLAEIEACSILLRNIKNKNIELKG